MRVTLEEQIDQWRSYLRHRQAIHSVDVAELEDHLREQIDTLQECGLTTDEAFLVAVKRMGSLDALSREFAREHSDRLWKQLVLTQDAESRKRGSGVFMAIAFAVVAALLVKLPLLFGFGMNDHEDLYVRNASLFTFPVVAAYFVWKRELRGRVVLWMAAAFVAALIVANVYPFQPKADTEILMIVHLPIALWMVVGVAYAADRWRRTEGRMDLIRFTGELFIYFVLIAAGGGVLLAFVAMIFDAIGMHVEPLFQFFVPSAAAGALVIASWLVEAKQSVVENMAPVLARLFTPLFTIALLTFIGALLWTLAIGGAIDRNILLAFDGLLVVVLALLLYSISARDPRLPPGVYDVMQVVLVISALVADVIALWAIAGRITEFGFTANRVAALGINVILLVNLAWSAVLYSRFLRRRGPFTSLEKWHTGYLAVYAAWAVFVVVFFPLIFGYR